MGRRSGQSILSMFEWQKKSVPPAAKASTAAKLAKTLSATIAQSSHECELRMQKAGRDQTAIGKQSPLHEAYVRVERRARMWTGKPHMQHVPPNRYSLQSTCMPDSQMCWEQTKVLALT